ncbi:type IX secretion system membrane protein PorP/SprF [Pedobacter sp. CCM 8938]|uniref:Type IX secretion system membrane protein PorP/SprF n=1 Tax=Pedobacter fastidiosus TaxID=2765361 RepID=A0ABR7KXN5_9SPHI|nr:type IX secretion system membrane protein PorP/SprF [Pedobacter fastidiosus]MBC6112890.1 type IX secretion system membrane protein PorP/SprF [Pedobacter fastidiosus]
MKKILIISILLISVKVGYCQLNPMGSMYYQNQYLANPAIAGIEQGWELNAGYKAQWTAIEGAPAMEAVTATYGTKNKKIGLGLNFFNDQAGVVQRTSVKATYAYHLPLNSGSSFIDFGLSAGVMDEWIDFNKVRGDLNDPSLYNFNQRSVYFDGDFGIAYRNKSLTIQGALPNLKRFLNRDLQRTVADRSLYMASISYNFLSSTDNVLHSIEPKVVYRGVENYKDILDAGANLQFFGNKLLLNGMYHSTNSVTIGAGTTYKNQLTILTQYTTNTADLQNYSNGEFEIALKYNFR